MGRDNGGVTYLRHIRQIRAEVEALGVLTRRELPLKLNSASYKQGVGSPSESTPGRRWRDDCPSWCHAQTPAAKKP
jgi:hypothetical protein